jgi:glycosyltransferase involved in cell wall biosynthesis
MFLAIAYQKDDRPRQEAKCLIEAGHDVLVFCWDREHEFKSIELMDGATVLSTRLINLRRFTSMGLIVGAFVFQILLVINTIRLVSHLRRRPIIHVHDFNTLLPGCLLRALRICTNLVYDSHELSYAAYSEFMVPAIGQIVDTIERHCVGYADAIITVSEPIADYLREFNPSVELVYNCPEKSKIPNVARSEVRRQLGLPLGSYIVSYVGSIRYDSRLDLLLEVASLLWEKSNILFVVVGWGPLASEFQEATRKKRARVTLIPYVPHERALRYLAASDLSWGICQNRSLNMRLTIPWKFFESLACRVPLLVAEGTYRAVLVKKFRSGIVLESDDPHEMSRLILSLANDPSKSSCAFDPNSIPPEFTWEGTSRTLVEIYERFSTVK